MRVTLVNRCKEMLPVSTPQRSSHGPKMPLFICISNLSVTKLSDNFAKALSLREMVFQVKPCYYALWICDNEIRDSIKRANGIL